MKGLNIGAPVDFRGVNIGTVTDIKIVLNKKDLSLLIPVFIEIDPNRISFDGTESELKKLVETKGTETFTQLLINRGLKAQLAMQSLVTGQLGIHLDFYPDKPVKAGRRRTLLYGNSHDRVGPFGAFQNPGEYPSRRDCRQG